MQCMKENKSESGKCRHLSKLYLQCRMENNLMEKDEMSNLGFRDDPQHSQNSGQLANNDSGSSSQSSSSGKGGGGGGGRLV